MSDQTITSLIEKLEGAEVGSRELDVSLAWNSWVEPKLWASTTSKGVTVWKVERQGKRVPLPNYTTSLDAALSLAERVLTMGAWDVGYTYNSDRPHYARLVIVRDDEGQPEIYGRAATPALALCAAILRAQSEARV